MNANPSFAQANPVSGALDTYLALQRDQMAWFARQLPHYVAATRWPRVELERVRTERLRRILTAAKTRSPWHARRLAAIDVQTITAGDVDALPTMTKADLMNNFDEIVSDPAIHKEAVDAYLSQLCEDAYFASDKHAVTSGGSSGERGIFVFDREGWIAYGLSSARPIELMLNAVPGSDERGAAIMGGAAVHSSVAFAQSFRSWIGKRFKEFCAVPIELPIGAIVERLNAIQPTFLSAYPSFLGCLCQEAFAGRLRIRPRVVLAGGETLLREHEADIRKAFGATILDFYGCSEASCLAYSCPHGDGLHLSEDTAIVEPVDKNGQASAPGSVSDKVLVTNLTNELLPIIRYELDDAIAVAGTERPCPCGSHFRKIDRVIGRSEDMFIYGDGTVIEPFGLQSVLAHVPAIVNFQIRQTATGVDAVVQATSAFDRGRLANQIREKLVQLGLPQPSITLQCVERIGRTAAGKCKRFVALRPAQEEMSAPSPS